MLFQAAADRYKIVIEVVQPETPPFEIKCDGERVIAVAGGRDGGVDGGIRGGRRVSSLVLESGAARVQQDMEPDQPHKIGGWVTVPWPEMDFS